MYEYFQIVVQISPKYCPILSRYYQILSKYQDIAQILSKALSIHCPNIVQIFPKYCPNIIQLLFDHCPNIP